MRTRRTVLLALVAVLAAAVVLAPQTPQGRGWIVDRAQRVLANAGYDVTADASSGNPYRGIRLEGVDVRASGIDVHADALELRYFLPSLLTAELPLSVRIDGLRGTVEVGAVALPTAAGGPPPVRVRLDAVDLSDARVDLGDVPYTIPDVALDEIRLEGSGTGLDVAALVTTADGSARLAGQVGLDPPRADLEVLRADLTLARPWWTGVTGGVASGRLTVADGAIDADLDVRAGSVEELGLDVTDITGTVHYAHPRVDADLSGDLWGGRTEMAGAVDIGARSWQATATGDVALAQTAAWLARTLDVDPSPWVDGRADVTLEAHGWRDVDLRGSARGSGSLAGRALDDLAVDFGFDAAGATTSLTGRLAGGALTVGLAPTGDGRSDLTLALRDADLAAGLRVRADAAFGLGSGGLEGRVDARAVGTVLGRTVDLSGDAAVAPDTPWEFYLAGDDEAGSALSGAFVLDGSDLTGGVTVRDAAVPGLDARPSLTLRADGPVDDLPLRLELTDGEPVALARAGVGRVDADLRGTLTARLRGGDLGEIDGRFGPLRVTGSVSTTNPWELEGAVDRVALRPDLAAAGPIDASVPAFVVRGAPRTLARDEGSASAAAAAPSDDAGGSSTPLELDATVELGDARLGPVGLGLPDVRLRWASGDFGATITSLDSSTGDLTVRVAEGGIDATLAGLAVTVGDGADVRALELGGTIRSDATDLALDVRAQGDGTTLTVTGTRATELRAEARATPGLVLGPVATAAPLAVDARLRDTDVRATATLGDLGLTLQGALSGRPTANATVQSEDARLELAATDRDFRANGALDLGAAIGAVRVADATLPELAGTLRLDATASRDAPTTAFDGTARLDLVSPVRAQVNAEAVAGAVRIDAAADALAASVSGDLWPTRALVASVGPLERLRLDGDAFSGSGVTAPVRIGQTRIDGLPWSLAGGLDSRTVRLDMGESSVTLEWSRGWAVDATVDVPVVFGDSPAGLRGTARAGSAAPAGAIDLALVPGLATGVAAGAVADPSTDLPPWLALRGTLDGARLGGALPARVAASLGPALPAGASLDGDLEIDGRVAPRTLVYDVRGEWAAASFEASGQGGAVDATLRIPPDAHTSDSAASATGDAGPLDLRVSRTSDGTRIDLIADHTPVETVARRVSGLPEPLRDGAAARALGLDGSLALDLAPGASTTWRGDLTVALRPGVDADALPVAIEGAAAIRGAGRDLRIDADLRVEPRDDGTPLVLGATGTVLPELSIGVDLAYAGASATGDVAWPAGAGLPRVDGRLTVPATAAPIAFAGLELSLETVDDTLRVEGGAPGASTFVSIGIGPQLDGRARIPIRVADAPVVLDASLGGTVGAPRAEVIVDGAVRGTIRFGEGRGEAELALDPARIPGDAWITTPPRIRIEATTDGAWQGRAETAARLAGTPGTVDLRLEGQGLRYVGTGTVSIADAPVAALRLDGNGGSVVVDGDVGVLDPTLVAALSRDAADLAGRGAVRLSTAPLALDIDVGLSGTVAGLPADIEVGGDLSGVDVDVRIADASATVRPRPTGGVAISVRAPDTDVAGALALSPAPMLQVRGTVLGRTLRIDGAPSTTPQSGDAPWASTPLTVTAAVADVDATVAWSPASAGDAARVTLSLTAGPDLAPLPVLLGAEVELPDAGEPRLALNAALAAESSPLRSDLTLAGTLGASLDLSGSLRNDRLDAPAPISVSGPVAGARLEAIVDASGDRPLTLAAGFDGVTVTSATLDGLGTVAGIDVDATPGLSWTADATSVAPAGFTGASSAESAVGGLGRLHVRVTGTDDGTGRLGATARLIPTSANRSSGAVDAGADAAPTPPLELRATLPADPFDPVAGIAGTLHVDAGDTQRVHAEGSLGGTLRAPTLTGALDLSGSVDAAGDFGYAAGRAHVALEGDGIAIDLRGDLPAWDLRADLRDVPAAAFSDVLPASIRGLGALDGARVTFVADVRGSLGADAPAGLYGTIDPLTLETDGSRLEGRASLGEDALATLRTDLDLAEIAPSLSGRLAGPLVVRGGLGDLRAANVDAALVADAVAIAALPEQFGARLLVSGTVGDPSLALRVSADRGADAAGSLELEVAPLAGSGHVRSDLHVGPLQTDLEARWDANGVDASGDLRAEVGPRALGLALDSRDRNEIALNGLDDLVGWSGTFVPAGAELALQGPLGSLAEPLRGLASLRIGPLRGAGARTIGILGGEASDDASDADPWLELDLVDVRAAGVDVGDVAVRAADDPTLRVAGTHVNGTVDLAAPFAWSGDLTDLALPADLVLDARGEGTLRDLGVRARANLRGRTPGTEARVDLAVNASGATIGAEGTVFGGDLAGDLGLGPDGWDGVLVLQGATWAGQRFDVDGRLSGTAAAPEFRATTAVDGAVSAAGDVWANRSEVRIDQTLALPGLDDPLVVRGTAWPAPSLTLADARGGALRASAPGLDAPLDFRGQASLRGPFIDVSATGIGGQLRVAVDAAASTGVAAGVRSTAPSVSLLGFGDLVRQPVRLSGTGDLAGSAELDVRAAPRLRAVDLTYAPTGGPVELEFTGALPLGDPSATPDDALAGRARIAAVDAIPALRDGLDLDATILRSADGGWHLRLDGSGVDAEARLAADRALEVDVRADRSGARLDGALAMRPGTGLDGSLEITDVTIPWSGLDTHVTGTASVAGDLARAALVATFAPTPAGSEADGGDAATVDAAGTVELDGSLRVGRWLPDAYDPGTSDALELTGLARLRTLDLAAFDVVQRRAPYVRLPVSGTVDVRGDVLLGTFVAPDAAVADTRLPTSATLTGTLAGDAPSANVQGRIGDSIFSGTVSRASASGVFRLERFPFQVLAEALTGPSDIEASTTGVLRWSLPYAHPLDGELRLATERIALSGSRGATQGHVVLDYADRVLTLGDVAFGGVGDDAGSWSATGRVGDEAIELDLTAADADFTPLLDLVPPLARLSATARGSFDFRARGTPTEPTVTFASAGLDVGIAGGAYTLADARVSVDGGRLEGQARLDAARPVAGSLSLRATADLSLLPLVFTDAELTFEGRSDVPGLGAVENVRGTIASRDGGAVLDARGALGTTVRLSGDLAPLDLRLVGRNAVLSSPQWFLERAQTDLDLRLRTEPGGLVLDGAIDVAQAAFALGIREQATTTTAPGAPAPDAAAQRAARAARARLRFGDLRVRAPSGLTLSENFGSLEARADLTLAGTAADPVLEGSADAIRGSVRFSGRDFTLRTAQADFERSRGVYPQLRLVAASSFEKSSVRATGGQVRFVEPRDGARFDVVLAIDGEVQATPGDVRPFAVQIDPALSSTARIEVDGGTAATEPRGLAQEELLQLVTLGQVDVAASNALQADLASTVAQSALDTAVDLLFLTEFQQALADALGVDVLELRTSRISSLLAGGLEDPFSVSLRIGQYLSEDVYASIRIGNIDDLGQSQALSNEVSVRFELGAIAIDLAGALNFPNALSDLPVPSLRATVGYAVSPFARLETGIDVSSLRSRLSFGVTLRW